MPASWLTLIGWWPSCACLADVPLDEARAFKSLEEVDRIEIGGTYEFYVSCRFSEICGILLLDFRSLPVPWRL